MRNNREQWPLQHCLDWTVVQRVQWTTRYSVPRTRVHAVQNTTATPQSIFTLLTIHQTLHTRQYYMVYLYVDWLTATCSKRRAILLPSSTQLNDV